MGLKKPNPRTQRSHRVLAVALAAYASEITLPPLVMRSFEYVGLLP